MARDDLVRLEGKVTKTTGGGFYIIELENGHVINAKLSGKMKRYNIRVVVGDHVSVSVSPYDTSHGLIVHRGKSQSR